MVAVALAFGVGVTAGPSLVAIWIPTPSPVTMNAISATAIATASFPLNDSIPLGIPHRAPTR